MRFQTKGNLLQMVLCPKRLKCGVLAKHVMLSTCSMQDCLTRTSQVNRFMCIISACLSQVAAQEVFQKPSPKVDLPPRLRTLFMKLASGETGPEQRRNKKGCLSKAGTCNTIFAGDYSFQA